MNEPSYLEFTAGAFNVQSRGATPVSTEGSIEYRYGRKLFWLGPAFGLLGNQRGGLFGYTGFYSDIKIAPFVITPMAGLGLYHRGGALDLGGPLEFRLSLEAAYQFNDFSLLGVQFSQLSNLDMYSRNPSGSEILVTYTIPIPEPF
jgi:lipid A 3-O-deacylase